MERTPIRTWLFAPGSSPRILDRAAEAGADAVVADLEDAVPPSGKSDARGSVAGWIDSVSDREFEAWVRVNAGPGGFDVRDVAEVTRPGLTGLVLPKAEDPGAIDLLADHLSDLESARGLPIGSVRIAPLVESPAGLLAAEGLCRGGRGRVVALMFGGLDYLAALGVSGDIAGPAVRHALATLAVVAAANGVVAVDTVFPAVEDEQGLRDATRSARDLGCFGKLVIHPRQLGPVAETFTPSATEVDRALRVVEAFERSVSEGSGVLLLDGRMIDAPVVAVARRTLRMAASVARR